VFANYKRVWRRCERRRSTGVTGSEDGDEVALLLGPLRESSGSVKWFSEACSAALMSCAIVT
jgi:hypothetical protein